MADYFEVYRYSPAASGDDDDDGGAVEMPAPKRMRVQPVRTEEPELDTTQRAVVDAVVEKRRTILLTGPAGVGKSSVLREIVRRLQREEREIAVTASTGRAAVELDLGATTLHSFVCLGREKALNVLPTTTQGRRRRARAIDMAVKKIYRSAERLKRVRDTKVLIIEEVSMISAALMDAVDEVLARTREMRTGTFAALQMVFVGDFAQLPPVKGKYAFESRVWRNLNVERHTLHIQYRQALDSQYAEILNRARFGTMTADDIRVLKTRETSRKVIDRMGDTAVHLYSRNEDAGQHNADCLRNLGEVETHRYDVVVDVEPTDVTNVDRAECARARRDANAWLLDNKVPTRRTVCVGARVMLTANVDVANGLANGALGRVIGFERRNGEGPLPLIRFDRSGRVRVVGRYRREFELNRSFTGFYEELPLIFAFSLTIHRAQGITIEGNLVTALGGSDIFTNQQAYVALSRVRRLSALHLIRISSSAVRVASKVKAFYNGTRP
jgi:ATP-dependent DNA helicase PIF1